MKNRHFAKRNNRAFISYKPNMDKKYLVVTPILSENYEKESCAINFLERLGYKEIK